MTTKSDIYDSFDRMIVLCNEKVRLMIELKKGLRMADLLGMKPKDIKGKMRARVIAASNSGYEPRPWRGAQYTLQIDDGPVHKFPLIDVHKDLWPADMLAAHARWEKRGNK